MDATEMRIRRARLRDELASLDIEAKVIAERRDRLAKELDDLTAEINVETIAREYPAFERELLKIQIV